MRNITFSLEAAKALRGLGDVAVELCAAIAQDDVDRAETGDLSNALAGSRRKRLFIGDFSIIFEDIESVRVVTKIGPRHS
jgi:hypothetical protein